MRTLIITSSQSPESRSTAVANIGGEWLRENGHDVSRIHLRTGDFPGFDSSDLFESEIYLEYAKQVLECDALLLASPVYNWGICSEIKKFIEVVGSTNSSRPSPFFDKLVSVLLAAGLPHSYMAFGSMAMPLMMDFRCIINPYQAYIHNRHWTPDGLLTDSGRDHLERMLLSHVALSERLQGHRMTSQWQI